MKLKRILLMLMISMLVSTGVLASSQAVTVTIDGVRLQTDSPARIVNDRTLVPVRAIFESMGAKVDWDENTRTVTGIRGNDKILLQIQNAKASLNGRSITLQSPPIIIDSRTFVPVRFVAESFGADVDWDAKNRTVIINSRNNTANFNELEVLKLVNIERTKAGLHNLEMSNQLSTIARMKSQDMADNNYFSHNSPTYGRAFDMMNKFGISYNIAGENIAMRYKGPQDVMNGWMNSSGHRANILNPKFGTLGIGYVNKNGTTYWTQMFTD